MVVTLLILVLNQRVAASMLAIQMAIFCQWIMKIDSSFKRIKKQFKRHFHVLLTNSRYRGMQSFEWICEAGSHKQRCVPALQPDANPAHLGEWLWNYTLSAALQNAFWNGQVCTWVLTSKEPTLWCMCRKLSPSSKAPFPSLFWEDGGQGGWPMGPISCSNCRHHDCPSALREMGLPSALGSGLLPLV